MMRPLPIVALAGCPAGRDRTPFRHCELLLHMVVIVGCIIVLASVLGGFTIAGGSIAALIHPSEFLTIGGSAFGAMVVMAPVKVLKDLAKGLLQCLKGSPYNKQAYDQLFSALYELFRLARRD